VTCIQGYEAVDEVFKHCEAHGQKLSSIMRVWAEAAGSSSAANSQAGTPNPDPGVHLVRLPDQVIEQSKQATNDALVKEAFEGYIQNQPPSIPKGVVLKDYQMLGLNWLNLLYRRKISCILADEMGEYLPLIEFFDEA
jgi:SWI/SNF-related matrix-associated actin-dependent regulator 1 of chromatin subfamily A